MQSPRPPALLFDLDGTLVDSAQGIAAALTVLRVERGGAPVLLGDVRPLVSLGVETLVARALGEQATNADCDVPAFRRILHGMPNDPATLYGDVPAVLDALHRSGHNMAIVTNKPEGLSRKLLDEVGLAHLFRAVVGGDTTSHAKPHRAPLERALALIGARAADCVFIGDSDVDAAAAWAFAMPFLLFTGGYGADLCDDADVRARFASFADLPGLIARVRG